MAVNSCCGDKGWHKINNPVICMRAVGATHESDLERFGVEPLTRRQVQLALYKLRDKKLIHLYVWKRRISYAGRGTMPEENFKDIVAGDLKRLHEKRKHRAHTPKPLGIGMGGTGGLRQSTLTNTGQSSCSQLMDSEKS